MFMEALVSCPLRVSWLPSRPVGLQTLFCTVGDFGSCRRWFAELFLKYVAEPELPWCEVWGARAGKPRAHDLARYLRGCPAGWWPEGWRREDWRMRAWVEPGSWAVSGVMPRVGAEVGA